MMLIKYLITKKLKIKFFYLSNILYLNNFTILFHKFPSLYKYILYSYAMRDSGKNLIWLIVSLNVSL